MPAFAAALIAVVLVVPSVFAADPTGSADPTSSAEPSVPVIASDAGPSAGPETTPPASGEPNVAPASSVPSVAVEGSAAATPTTTLIGGIAGSRVINVPMYVSFQLSPGVDGGTLKLHEDGIEVLSDILPSGTSYWTFTYTPSKVGMVTLDAAYGGTAAFAPSSSAPMQIEIYLPPPSSVEVVSSLDPAPRSVPITFTATVLPNPGGGSIEWLIDGTAVETVVLDGAGTATHIDSFDTPPDHTVVARFTGSATYRSMSSLAFDQRVVGDLVVVSVETPQSPMPLGEVVATIRVTPNPGGGSIVYNPQFGLEHTVPLGPDGSVDVDLGVYTSPGVYAWQFRFTGSGIYGTARTDYWLEIAQPSSTTVASNVSTATAGELPVVLTGTVVLPQIYTSLQGTVTFHDVVGGVPVDLGPVSIAPSSLTATFSSSNLRVGTHTITAVYSGEGHSVLPSTSAPIVVVVAADKGVNATLVPSLATFYPYKDLFRDTSRLGGKLNERATVTIRLYNSSNVLKRSWALGWKNPGGYYATWNGRTAAGSALPAGKYKVVASLKDARGNTRKLTAYVTISWRKAIWKSVSVTRYGDQLTYYVDIADQGQLYYSPDYPRGRILDSGSMIRGCVGCGFVGGRYVWTLASGALEYRSIYIQVRGHGFTDREHPGEIRVVDPKTGDFGDRIPNCEYDQVGTTCGLVIKPGFVSSTRHVESWMWMTQAWGDAYDLYYLKLTYKYAVLA
jgi:hypothetical protein